MCWRVYYYSLIFNLRGEIKMLNFENIEDLVSHMFEKLDGDEPVSVVANKDLAISIMQELLEYKNVILKYANVDDYDYDKEYIVTLHDDYDSDSWDIAIEPIYNYEKEMYFGTDGYVLFHEDANSKAMIDMKNNENIELSGHDWFTIGEEESEDIAEDDTNEETDLDGDNPKDELDDSDYSVTIKVGLDSEEAEEMIRDMEKNLNRHVSNMFDMLYRPYLYEYHSHPIRFYW